MATIALYANKVNNMPSLLSGVNSSVRGLKTELGKIKLKSLAVSSQICDLEEVISTISAATQTQEDKAEALEDIHDKLIDFIDDVERIDDDVADEVEQSKDDFYNKYYYLKPDCEKTGWEKFKDGCKKVVDWCKDNWQSLAKIVAAVVIIVALGVASVLTGGALAVILAGAFWGALIGGLAGGVIGGITSALTGGSFLDGFADGLLSGTISGAISGALTGGGQVLGKLVECGTKLGKVLKATSVVTNVLSTGMDGFDMLAMGIGLFDPNNALVKLNAKLHESTAYNIFQTGVGFVADFTGGAASTMTCFAAGTLVLTPAGLITIENIHPGDTVISTDPDTGEVAEKTVLESFVHETTELVHLTVNGEVITSTTDHPFYVKDAGFVAAGELYIGDKLLDAQGNELVLEDMRFETTETPVKVYNFKVEDFHTYHVGTNGIFVHNADCSIEFTNKRNLDREEFTQQLADQEAGLNSMTVDEYLRNREAYKQNGRSADSVKYQNNARAEAISARVEHNLDSGMDYDAAVAEANAWAKDKAALHGPDQIAGGDPSNIIGLGDSGINSSIGSQWKAKGRIGVLDQYVQDLASKLTPEEMLTTFLNVELLLKP